MAYLVDSSVFVGLMADDDVHHTRAVAMMTKVDQMYVPYCVVNETVTVLAYKYSLDHALSFLSFLHGNRDVVHIEHNLTEELAWYPTLGARVSFTDATLVLLSRAYQLKLLTFDKQLAKLARRAV